MTRRWPLLAAALVLALNAPVKAAAAEPAGTAPTPATAASDGGAGRALHDLRADAAGAVRVHRDSEGAVAFVSSTNGPAMVDSHAGSPRRSAQQQLAAYGDAFGIDGDTSKAVVTQTVDSSTGARSSGPNRWSTACPSSAGRS